MLDDLDKYDTSVGAKSLGPATLRDKPDNSVKDNILDKYALNFTSFEACKCNSPDHSFFDNYEFYIRKIETKRGPELTVKIVRQLREGRTHTKTVYYCR